MAAAQKQSASGAPVMETLQAGRAVAALLVVFFHNGGSIFALDKYWGHDPLNNFFQFGHAGVAFFFVLSGFIIFHAHWNDAGKPERVAAFARKRFLRIYPVYWLALAALVPVYFMFPFFGKGYERDLPVILQSIFLVNMSTDATVIPVAWTLYHEILFYALFALVIFNKRLGFTVLALWFCASALPFVISLSPVPYFYLSPIHILFAAGMAGCWLFHRGLIKMPLGLFVTGVALFALAAVAERNLGNLKDSISNPLYGPGCFLMLLGLVEMERSGRIKSVPVLLKILGDASYVIYLTHFALLSLFAKIFIGLKIIPVPVSYILLPSLSVFTGVMIHIYLESPVLRRFHYKLRTIR